MELFIIRNGEQTGPFSTDTITALLNTGSVKPGDMAWRKGLPGWMPLTDAMNLESMKRDEPPPLEGAATPRRKATAKQKVLLSFLGAVYQDDITKDEAAVVISDAIENPKHAGRFAKWNEEKLRLHPDVFQDEVDYRRANRVARYLEQCQAEGSEAVKDVTKAHVQVLIESLDKRNPTWEQEPRRALWDFLLPCVAEHFPQLVKDDWKDKLRFGGAPKIAASVSATPTAATLVPPNPPGAIHAALRGIIYGAMVLGIVLGGLYWWENRKGEGAQGGQVVAKNPEPEKKPTPAPEPPAPAPDHPTETPAIAAKPPEEPPKPEPAPPTENPVPAPEKPPVPTVAANTTPPAMTEPVPVTPAPAPAPAPSNPSPAFTPAPPPPPLTPAPTAPTATATPAPAPAPAPAAKDYATMTKAVAVQLQFGRVILQVGTRVKFIAVEGPNARVTFNNNVILVPLAATDIDPNALPATAQTNPTPPTTPLPTAPPAPAPVPATTNTPVKPSSDL